jgi:hypothetical protein
MRATDEERGLTMGEIWDDGEDAGRRRGLRWISLSYACMQVCSDMQAQLLVVGNGSLKFLCRSTRNPIDGDLQTFPRPERRLVR